MSDSQDTADDLGEIIETNEEIVRCSGTKDNGQPCEKFLTKLISYFSVSAEIRKLMHENGMSISQIVKGVEIKIGLETKCNRCKHMDYKLKVI